MKDGWMGNQSCNRNTLKNMHTKTTKGLSDCGAVNKWFYTYVCSLAKGALSAYSGHYRDLEWCAGS